MGAVDAHSPHVPERLVTYPPLRAVIFAEATVRRAHHSPDGSKSRGDPQSRGSFPEGSGPCPITGSRSRSAASADPGGKPGTIIPVPHAMRSWHSSTSLSSLRCFFVVDVGNVLTHPAFVSVRGEIHNERYYARDERAGGAFHTASKVLHSSNMATGDCRHRTKRDGRLDVPTGLWICQTSLSADLVDPARDQMVSLAKSAKRLQGSKAIKPVGFPVRRTTCPASIMAAK
jgi:hypothetical protein